MHNPELHALAAVSRGPRRQRGLKMKYAMMKSNTIITVSRMAFLMPARPHLTLIGAKTPTNVARKRWPVREN